MIGNAAVSKTRHPKKCFQKRSRNPMKMRQEGGNKVSIIEKRRAVVTLLYSTTLLYYHTRISCKYVVSVIHCDHWSCISSLIQPAVWSTSHLWFIYCKWQTGVNSVSKPDKTVRIMREPVVTACDHNRLQSWFILQRSNSRCVSGAIEPVDLQQCMKGDWKSEDKEGIQCGNKIRGDKGD